MNPLAAILCLLSLAAYIQPGISKTVQYKIVIKTGDVENAGTDAKVFINLFGNKGSTGNLILPGQVTSQFERGDTDTFTVYGKEVGRLYAIQIGHDNSGEAPGWYLDYVDVIQTVYAFGKYPRPKNTRYIFRGWIAADEGDGSLSKRLHHGLISYPDN
ncbi:lipoxygenase homology domain-containing protein 1-like [Physella acuta]|uniref:lipoxygenase homology domain-containing protein 1-like n=1 Tax=Physella acuta TaxID=109671 RepID=UPI0027DD0726|nr:lipoxygenase homology domain-containing protein 1-like [Physella acuta]